MSSLESNKAIALAALEADIQLDHERLRSLCSDDCLFLFPGSLSASGAHGWDSYVALHDAAGKSEHAMRNFTLHVGGVTAEDNRVVVETEISYELPDGTSELHQQVVFIYEIKDGKVAVFKEYFDTLRAADFHGLAPVTQGEPKALQSILGSVTATIVRPVGAHQCTDIGGSG